MRHIKSYYSAIYILAAFLFSGFTNHDVKPYPNQMKNVYEVLQSKEEISIDANWDKPIWKETKSAILENYMGEKPDHFPRTEMKMRYDENNIYVIFKVEDKYVKAIAEKTNGKVWEDSCVEFFFTPGDDTNNGYFNLETNCIGTFLMQYHNQISNDDGFVSKSDNSGIVIKSSLSKPLDQEIQEATTWFLEYKMPLSFLRSYLPYEQPGPGVKWRANFYKCGDKTSHPHWLTWAPVNFPKPKFHLPEFFGWLEFK